MRKNVVKLGKKITDDINITLGKEKMDESRPEYWMLDALLTDEQVELALHMKKRKPVTAEELAKKIKWDRDRVEKLLEEMAYIGIIEYNWHNADHHKQYVLPVPVVGSSENLILNEKQVEEHPEIGEYFYQMGYLPLKPISHMVPPGGAGMGFHVIPIETAIPKESNAPDAEHLSYWLKRYDDFAIMACVCRRSMRLRGEGCGELEDEVCIAVGDYAKYLVETDKAKKATYEEIIDLLRRSEENGYMHQITNGDGPEDIFAICNCTVGSCYALRCSQLFNNPNLSASAYRAKVDPAKCVACGKCVEACPAGAARLGQKLCTVDGPVKYPKQPLPDETPGWGEHMWNYNYRDDNQKNCYDTGTAPCKTACPAHIAVQGYVKMAAQGRYDEALKLIKQDNPFPAVCGSICNKRCESNCTRGSIDKPVSVDEIKKFIAARELHAEHRYVPEKKRHSGRLEDYEEKIAVIGAGPAGLSCAYYLANMGYPVTVFDKNSQPGGMLMMGIPNFRLEKDVVKAELSVLEEMGVSFQCNTEVGKDITVPQLREQGYRAFYMGIGAQGGRKCSVPGEDAEGVLTGIDFLRMVNEGKDIQLSEETVVIGGGNVAIDVARTAIRKGAEKVTMFCLEQRDEMTASEDEIAEAIEEGIEIKNGWGPKEILSENGRVSGITLKQCTQVFDQDHKFNPQYDETTVLDVACGNVLVTIGQAVLWGDLLEGSQVELNKNKTAKADPVTYQTSQPDIFVGGDAYSGPKFAIDAIAAGKEGAISIHRFVHRGQSLTLARNRRDFIALDKSNVVIPVDSYDAPARQSVRRDTAKKKTMSDDRVLLTEEQVKKEASRCLSCGATVVDQNRCIGCGLCTTKCRFEAISLERNHPEFYNYINGDYSQMAVLKHGIQRSMKIAVKKVTGAK